MGHFRALYANPIIEEVSEVNRDWRQRRIHAFSNITATRELGPFPCHQIRPVSIFEQLFNIVVETDYQDDTGHPDNACRINLSFDVTFDHNALLGACDGN
jgi:hypothetical protein